jgi:hypothetical protein
MVQPYHFAKGQANGLYRHVEANFTIITAHYARSRPRVVISEGFYAVSTLKGRGLENLSQVAINYHVIYRLILASAQSLVFVTLNFSTPFSSIPHIQFDPFLNDLF